MIHTGKQVDRRMKVFEFHDDKTTEYAILSHRWIDSTEVEYEEMVNLAKMDRQEQDEIRGRKGYKKIVDTCKQAKQDGYEWVWVDTCCIDTRSSTDILEAINSMYRWYANAIVCYAYLHDVDGPSFPTRKDDEKYPKDGWPEWFSRGWTLQEMLAPRNLLFFNEDWQPIGDKKSLADTLNTITGIPAHIFGNGLEGNRPCVAQIISWAANRTTTRPEDRAYSLMGLLGVNMPMLYGEGEKAFHRLQLEIIRTSSDQSIFAWGRSGHTIGSILADDPSSFKNCSDMELMDHDEFVQSLEHHGVAQEELFSIDQNDVGVFPVTNRGIQICMPLRPYGGSCTLNQAWLPCRHGSSGPPVTINLALRNSNYYRYCSPVVQHLPTSVPIKFCKVYLRYQCTPRTNYSPIGRYVTALSRIKF